MLQPTTLIKVLAFSATLSLSSLGAACAQDQPVSSATASFLKEMNERLSTSENADSEIEPSAFYVPYGNLKDITEEQKAQAIQTGQNIVVEMLQAYEKNEHILFSDKNSLSQAMKRVKQRADDIADETIAAQREEVLSFLGLDPDRSTNLYYFVSWSMPTDMLRSYALEAMWSGGTLVFKGVPPGQNFGDFMSQGLASLTYGKGVSANISLDPRLYDAYRIDTVPAIVLTTYRTEFECIGINPKSFDYNGKSLSYDTCPALDDSKYSRMTGAVTTNYALQTFIEDGFEEAKPYLAALARGFALGQVPDKAQKPFTGKWESVLSPSEKMAIERANGSIQELGSTSRMSIPKLNPN